jgi:hypothetical protein
MKSFYMNPNLSQSMVTPSSSRARKSSLSQAAFALAGLMIGTLTASAATTQVFSDDFEDGNRNGWFNASGTSLGPSSDSATHKLTGNALAVINSSATGLGYFTAVTLGVGESFTFSFNMSLTGVGDVSGGLVFGLFNSSGETKVAADGYSGTNLVPYNGYRAFSNPGSGAASQTTLSKNTATRTSIVDGTFTGLTDGIGNGINLAAATPYAVSLTIARTGASSISMTYAINGLTFTGTDSLATNFTFDTFGWKKGDLNGSASGGESLFLDDIVVSYSSIPEPSSIALLSALAIGMVTFCGRRSRRSGV